MAAERLPARRRARGFTLLEVLIGLVVLSALLALTRTAALQGRQPWPTARSHDGRLAGANLLAETRIANPFPPVGTSNGTRRFGPAEWRWEINVQPTQVATIRRIDVRVFADADHKTALAQLSGLTGEDLLP